METIDLNDMVSIKLTESGADFINQKNKKYNANCKNDIKRTDYKENDIYACVFHELLCVFSGYDESEYFLLKQFQDFHTISDWEFFKIAMDRNRK